MYYEYECRKNCIHRDLNGNCKHRFDVKNSIFRDEVKPCIYFSERQKNSKVSSSYDSMQQNLT
jgi:hypothetical protein